MHGHVVFGEFYSSRSKGIDLSLAVDVTEKEAVVIKLDDVDKKPIDYLANEVLSRAETLRSSWPSSAKANTAPLSKLLSFLPPGIAATVCAWLYFMESQLGVSTPLLGLVAFPLGVCTLVSAMSQEGPLPLLGLFPFLPS